MTYMKIPQGYEHAGSYGRVVSETATEIIVVLPLSSHRIVIRKPL